MEKEEQTSYKFDSKTRRKIEIIDTLLAIIIIALCIWALINYNFIKNKATSDILVYGNIGLFISTFFLELIPQMLNPYLPLVMAIGLGWNVHLSIILTSLGSGLGAMLGIYLGRKYGWRLIYPLFEEKTIAKITKFWKKYGKIYVLVSVLTPVPESPLVFGSLGMTLKEYLWYGIIPRTISFIVLGYAIHFGFGLGGLL